MSLSTEYPHLPGDFEILVILKSSLELVHGSLLSWLRSWSSLLSRLRTIRSIIEQKISATLKQPHGAKIPLNFRGHDHSNEFANSINTEI